MTPSLFSPLQLRETTLRNRIVLSPMCTYSATDGLADDFHLAHYGRFALGGLGLAIVEATAVTRDGRISNGCLGLWSDAHIAGLSRIADAFRKNGTVPAIQLAHAGRKAATRRGYLGDGPLLPEDHARGETEWQPIGATAQPFNSGWQTPTQATPEQLETIKTAFCAAARRALAAGFEVIELHMGHGYLLQSFLSPLSNQRQDTYGGSLENRMLYPLELVAAMRATLGPKVPLFVRISAVEWTPEGWSIEDSLTFAAALKLAGVDVVDCSTGGNLQQGAPSSKIPQGQGYQAVFAAHIRAEIGIKTQAVGLIRDPNFADALIRDGKADLIALGRGLLNDPNWALHALHILGLSNTPEAHDLWPIQYRSWITKWAAGIARRGEHL